MDLKPIQKKLLNLPFWLQLPLGVVALPLAAACFVVLIIGSMPVHFFRELVSGRMFEAD